MLHFPRFRNDCTNEHLQWKRTRTQCYWSLLPQAQDEGLEIAIVPRNCDISPRPWRAVERLVPPRPHER